MNSILHLKQFQPLRFARLAFGRRAPLRPDHVDDRVDQGQVGERLREVAEMTARLRVDLLSVEVQRAGQ